MRRAVRVGVDLRPGAGDRRGIGKIRMIAMNG